MSVEINSSVVLKLVRVSEDAFPHSISGPVYGFENSVSHVYAFPGNHSEDATVRPNNVKFQSEVLDLLKQAHIGATAKGWFISAVGGKFLSQSLLESMLSQRAAKQESGDDSPVLLLVHDPSKQQQGILSLGAFTLSENFLNVATSKEKYTTKNLNANDLSYKNILQEIPIKVHNPHLINLTIQELTIEDDHNILNLSNSATAAYTTIDQLFETVDNFNYNQGNFHYYQRSLSRELPKISQWKQKAKLENLNKLKANPELTEKDLVSLDDWSKHIKLPTEPSRFENLVLSGLLNNYCNDLESSGVSELLKTFSTQKGLDI
ncbi:unnamed protein product [Kuraishia capsulata CBS 1993]|uniref:eIF3h C-terminal domain-containing protein n=1 Tax=Kuraishia capsulata CBS 1993 TaxID=1382522 RepID=W6MMF5_9ASCO|nr:uncharacterized protein KUCA_T00003361001 [Kuraishia capsulata CBS 1993]CDK27383.1 unnamed protein product [Kuraishia capsulata CBS 1993]